MYGSSNSSFRFAISAIDVKKHFGLTPVVAIGIVLIHFSVTNPQTLRKQERSVLHISVLHRLIKMEKCLILKQ